MTPEEAVLAVACPRCKAAPQAPCVVGGEASASGYLHRERYTAAASNQVREMEPPTHAGTTVRDASGQTWKFGRTRWTCQAKVGTRYFDPRLKRWEIIEQVARLPFSEVIRRYGPVEITHVPARRGA